VKHGGHFARLSCCRKAAGSSNENVPRSIASIQILVRHEGLGGHSWGAHFQHDPGTTFGGARGEATSGFNPHGNAMHLIVIFGPAAVGKMTVGRELERLSSLRLFHNHMSIELALQFFSFGMPAFGRMVQSIRATVFEEVAKSDLPGLIFTYMWALDQPSDREDMDKLIGPFVRCGAKIGYVELAASQEERLRRNTTPLRLAEKPSKRDVERSNLRLVDHDSRYCLNTDGEFFYPDQHFKIDNTNLEPDFVATQIMERFAIPRIFNDQ